MGMRASKIDDGVMIQVDDIIRRLEEWGQKGCKGWKIPLLADEILLLSWYATEVLLQQPGLLQLQPPITICGNINGHFLDLIRLLELGGYPPFSNYLFLGSYVDYDNFGLESTCLLLAYKIKYPNNVFFLRGKDEIQYIEGKNRFYQDFVRKFNYPVMECLFDCLKCLPMAALIGDKIFCVHGGLSPELQNFDQIRSIVRPTAIPDAGLLRDLLTSNPSQHTNGWHKNDNGEYTFGSDKVSDFLNKHRLQLICQSHQVVNDGYKFFAGGQLLSISSTLGYPSLNRNGSAIMIVENYSECFIQTLNPIILGKSNKLGTNLIELTSLQSLKEVEEIPGKAPKLASKLKQVMAKNKLSIEDLEVITGSLVEEKYNTVQEQTDDAVIKVKKLLMKIKELEQSQQDNVSRLQQFKFRETRELRLEVRKLESMKQDYIKDIDRLQLQLDNKLLLKKKELESSQQHNVSRLQQKLQFKFQENEELRLEVKKLESVKQDQSKDNERLQLQLYNANKEVEELSLQLKKHKSLQQENELLQQENRENKWLQQENRILQQKLQNAVEEYEKRCIEFDKQKSLSQTALQHHQDIVIKEAKEPSLETMKLKSFQQDNERLQLQIDDVVEELSLQIKKHKSLQQEHELLQQDKRMLQQKLKNEVEKYDNVCIEFDKQKSLFQTALQHQKDSVIKHQDNEKLQQKKSILLQQKLEGAIADLANVCLELEKQGAFFQARLHYHQGNPVKDDERLLHQHENMVKEANALVSRCERYNVVKEAEELGQHMKNLESFEQDIEIVKHQRDKEVGETEIQSRTRTNKFNSLSNDIWASLLEKQNAAKETGEIGLEVKQLLSIQKADNERLQHQRDKAVKTVEKLSVELGRLVTDGLNLVHGSSQFELQPDLETKLKSLQQENHEFQGKQEIGAKEIDVLSTEINQLATSTPLSFVYKFSYIELQQATNNFSDAFIIGKGGYGIVYKGVLQGTTVAIKVLRTGNQHGLVAFHREVAVLGKVRHPNIVSLMGVCAEAYAVVYEFLPNGSLEDCLAGKNKTQTLTWKVRTRIIRELRSALIFLHTMKPHPIVHGDLKPDNVLLDANMTSKLGDFGISRILNKSTTNTPFYLTENPTGTPGYIDPIFQNIGEVTTKSDVYSFGVIILRLLTGREVLGLVNTVESAFKTKKIGKIIDRDWPLSQANMLASLGLKCTQFDRKERPELVGDVWKDFENLH